MRKKWKISKQNEELVDFLSNEMGVTRLFAVMLVCRGIKSSEDALLFLSSNLSRMHDPFLLSGMEKAVERILHALKKNEKILVYGDYDVDGITAASLIYLFLKAVNADVSYFIPDRLEDGYGLNKDSLEKNLQNNFRLVITVDCGISSYNEVEYARERGVDVIITDHHEIPDKIPDACAVINPKLPSSKFPFKNLAGVGVAFNLAVALRKALRDNNYFTGINEPNLKDYLDIVAIGTIADIVSLQDENRLFVKNGLEVLSNSKRAGIAALKEVIGLSGSDDISAGIVAYKIAPRLNAAGRLGRGEDALKLLTTESIDEARRIAVFLDMENSRRQKMEEKALIQAKKKIEKNVHFKKKKSIVLASSSDDWHPGIIGIIASRLVEEYFKPAVIISLDEGVGKGSGRSIPSLHLYETLRECEEVLEAFGGHSQAAGLTILEENIDAFWDLFNGYVEKKLKETDFIPVIEIDSEISLSQLTPKFIQELKMLEPYGIGNPEPVLSAKDLRVLDSAVVGFNHLKLKVSENNSKIWEAIGYRMGDFLPNEGEIITLAFTPQIVTWQGNKSVQLKIKDFRFA